MPGSSSESVHKPLRVLFHLGTVGALTDGQLLEWFAARGEDGAEAAFEALVERHGPMVLRVCRRMLGNPHDAEDAFQATFLVLARQARSIRRRDSVASWLHGVAARVAARARADAARRRKHEQRSAAMAAEGRVAHGAPEEGRELHEELDRLPEKYRAPIVLCYLEGRTHEEAAQQLRWPVGTVKIRLTRARDLLRRRLVWRGLAPAAGLFATAEVSEVVSGVLVHSTVGAAIRVAAGRALSADLVSATAVALTQGVLTTMAWNKLKLAALAMLMMAAVTVMTAVGGARDRAEVIGPAAEGPRPEDEPVPPDPQRDSAGNPSERRNVVNDVEGKTIVLSILPVGTRVKKGDLVCELDSANLRDALLNQEITTRQAEAASKIAQLAHEVAETALAEYRNGSYNQELQKAKGDLALAESAVTLANEVLSETGANRTAKRSEVQKARLDHLRTQLALEQAQSRLNMLTKFTAPRRIRELESGMEKAWSDARAKSAALDLEKVREQKLRRQIEKCTLRAPIDGVVGAPLILGRGKLAVGEGDLVREHQVLFRIDPEKPDNLGKK
jgi:RNA polymerase sigma factor (sigma-70 family)